MYRLAEQVIREGFSPFARFLLGFVSAVFGLIMFVWAAGTKDPLFGYLLSTFCFAISLACIFNGRMRQFIGSCIGMALFVLTVGYLGTQLLDGIWFTERRSEPSVFNALLALVFFGIPGIRYVVFAKFGMRRSRV